MNTRQTVLVSIAIFLVCGLAIWWYFGFSLDFMNFFAAEPATSITVPTTVSCAPETQSVAVGAPAAFTGSGGNAMYQWFAPMGTPSTGTGSSFSVAYSTPGTKKVTIQSQRGDGSPQVDSVECTVVVTP